MDQYMKKKKRKIVDKPVSKSELNNLISRLFEGFDKHTSTFMSSLSEEKKLGLGDKVSNFDYEAEEEFFQKQLSEFSTRLNGIKRKVSEKYMSLVQKSAETNKYIEFPTTLDIVAVIFSYLCPFKELLKLRTTCHLFNEAFFHPMAIQALDLSFACTNVEKRDFVLFFLENYILYRTNNITNVNIVGDRKQKVDFLISWMVNNGVVFKNVEAVSCYVFDFIENGGFSKVFPKMRKLRVHRTKNDVLVFHAFFNSRRREDEQMEEYVSVEEFENCLPKDLLELSFLPYKDELFVEAEGRLRLIDGGVPVDALRGNACLRKFEGILHSLEELETLMNIPSLRNLDVRTTIDIRKYFGLDKTAKQLVFPNVKRFSIGVQSGDLVEHSTEYKNNVYFLENAVFPNLQSLRIFNMKAITKFRNDFTDWSKLTELILPNDHHFSIKKVFLKEMKSLTNLTCHCDLYSKAGANIFAKQLYSLCLYCSYGSASKFSAVALGKAVQKAEELKSLCFKEVCLDTPFMNRISTLQNLEFFTIDNSSGVKDAPFKKLAIGKELKARDVKILLQLADVPKYRKDRHKSYYVAGQLEHMECVNNNIEILTLNTIPRYTVIKCNNLRELNIENAVAWVVDKFIFRTLSPAFTTFNWGALKNSSFRNNNTFTMRAPFCKFAKIPSTLFFEKLNPIHIQNLTILELGSREKLEDIRYRTFVQLFNDLPNLDKLIFNHIKFIGSKFERNRHVHTNLRKLEITDSLNVAIESFASYFPNLVCVKIHGATKSAAKHFWGCPWKSLRIIDVETEVESTKRIVPNMVSSSKRFVQFLKFVTPKNAKFPIVSLPNLSSLVVGEQIDISSVTVKSEKLERFCRHISHAKGNTIVEIVESDVKKFADFKFKQYRLVFEKKWYGRDLQVSPTSLSPLGNSLSGMFSQSTAAGSQKPSVPTSVFEKLVQLVSRICKQFFLVFRTSLLVENKGREIVEMIQKLKHQYGVDIWIDIPYFDEGLGVDIFYDMF